MKRPQANRAVIAKRAKPRARATGSTGTDLRARTLTVVKPSGAGIRKRKASMTGAQRNSEGRRSEWTASPYIRDAVMTDAKWSRTVRECE